MHCKPILNLLDRKHSKVVVVNFAIKQGGEEFMKLALVCISRPRVWDSKFNASV